MHESAKGKYQYHLKISLGHDERRSEGRNRNIFSVAICSQNHEEGGMNPQESTRVEKGLGTGAAVSNRNWPRRMNRC